MKHVFLALGLMLSMAAWSQDDAPAEEVTEATDVDTAASEAEDVDDADLDEQVYTDEDDDFRPSEEIPADQSIPFPTDI